MPKNTNDRREMTPEEIAEREKRFRAFFSTTAVDLPEEMTRRGSGQTEGKTKKRFGFLGRNKAAQDAEQTEERPLEMPTGEVLLDSDAQPEEEADLELVLKPTADPEPAEPLRPLAEQQPAAVPQEPAPSVELQPKQEPAPETEARRQEKPVPKPQNPKNAPEILLP